MFSLLAGVRGPFEPFAEPRGLPHGLSDGLVAEWENWKEDGHTASYYSVAELLEHRDKPVTYTAYVDVKNYKQFKKTGKPSSWEYSLHNRKVLTNQEMDRVLKLMAFWDGEDPYTEITWEGSCKDIACNFWESIAEIQKLDSNSENLRCVFWFDN